MAKVGLKYLVAGKLTETTDGAATYGAKMSLGKAISCNVSVTNNSAKLYADDALAESDTSFQSGTMTLVVDRDDIATQAELLGHEYDETDGMIRNANDVAPYFGVGRVITKMINGVYSYKVEFVKKVKFSEPSQTDNTKGENLEFGTVQLEGTIATLASGDWSDVKVFDTLTAAVTYLDGKFTGAA